jgi:hypothetical protein
MINGKEFIPLTELKNMPSNNAAGNPYYTVPTGVRIHLAWMLLSLPAAKRLNDVVERFQLVLGDKLQRDVDINKADDLLTLCGPQYGFQGDTPGNAKCYVFWQFSEPDRESGIAKENYALDMPEGLIGKFQLKLRANAAHPTILRGGVVQEPLEFVPRGLRNLSERGLPVIAKYKQTDLNPGGTSADLDTQISALNQGGLMALSVYNPATAGVITQAVMKIDNRDKWNVYKEDNDAILKYFGMNPRGGVIDLVPDLLDKQNDAWDMGAKRAFKFNIQTDVAMTGGQTIVAKVWGEME